MPIAPIPRFFLRLAAVAGSSAIAGVLHPLAGTIVAVAGLFWLASRYDNHTGSIVLVTLLFLSVVAILVALLMLVLAMAAR